MTNIGPKKTCLFLTMGLFVALMVEGLSFVGGAILENLSSTIEMAPKSRIYEEQKEKILAIFRTDTNDIFDPDLGWAYRANYRGPLYSNNSVGLRGTREYERVPPGDIIRIAAFGDSFVYGSEVRDQGTWTFQLETLLPKSEVLNFGVGGYGTDQAFLRYLKVGRQYTPDIVLIGFVPDNLRRNVNIYRRFISTSELVHFKPRFSYDETGRFVLVPLPLKTAEDIWRYYEHPESIRKFGKLDYAYKRFVYENPFYDYSASVRLVSETLELVRRRFSTNRLFDSKQFNPDSEAFKVTLEIVRRFDAEAKRCGAIPLVLMFPNFEAITDAPSKRVKSYQPLMNALKDEGIEVLDLAESFNEPVSVEKHYMPGGHFSPHSNRLIAQFLASHLNARQLLSKSANSRKAHCVNQEQSSYSTISR